MDKQNGIITTSRQKGQALVEFALVAVVLLLFIFIIIEAGRLFQSWLTVQNSARAAGRYALTGKYDTDCLTVFPACLDPRVQSIKDEARRTAAGLNIDSNANAGTPRSFIAEVWSPDDEGNWKPDFAGRAGDPVRVKITYRMPFVVPFFTAIMESLGVEGQVTVTNEEFDQVTASLTYTTPPDQGQGYLPSGPPLADLKIEKNVHDNLEWVYAGKQLSWDITVENLGPFDVENVVVVDTIPADSVYLTSTVAGGGYCEESGGNTITCYLPNLAGDGGPASLGYVTIDTLAPTEAPDEVENFASVTNGPNSIDPDMDNNVVSKAVDIVPWADLGVTKSDDPDPVQAAKPLTYTIDIQNFEMNVANNVVITDDLPAEVVFLSADSACEYQISDHQVICDLLELSPGHSVEITISVAAPTSTGFYMNDVMVSADEDDLDPGNNLASETTRVVLDAADLSIAKTGPLSVNVGDQIEYEITVHNNGASSADEIVVTDILPSEVLYNGDSFGCDVDSSFVTCEIGSLTPGASISFTIQVSAMEYGHVLNTALVSGAVFDPAQENNTTSHETWILQSDLSILKDGPTSVSVGDQFDYSLTVANLGPSPATGVVVTDTMPVGLEIESANAGSNPCTVSSQVVECSIGFISSGESVPIVISVFADDIGTWRNLAIVTGNEYDPEPNNNRASAETIVTEADLGITKSSSPAYLGIPFTYTVDIVNYGPYLATDVVVTDTLPAEVEYISNDVGCTYYNSQEHSLVCNLADISDEGSTSIEILVRPTSAGDITNSVEVTSGGHDPDLDNNSNTLITTVNPVSDLKISVSGPGQVDKSTWFTVEVTIENLGPSPASGVVITNAIERGHNRDDIDSSDSRCIPLDDLTITCSVPGIFASGDSASFIIDIYKKSSDTYRNTAWVSILGYDPDLTNNTAFIDIIAN